MLEWIALNMVEGLKPVHRAALLREYSSPEGVFKAGEMELASVPGIKPELAYAVSRFSMRAAEEEIKKAKKQGVELYWLGADSYPALLRTIPDPPLVLYCKGELGPDEMAIAFVGSRKASTYGLNVTQVLVNDLAQAGFTIVSGLARGVDARAHNSALEAGARTVAVLGSGVDIIYPSEHATLAQRIARQGAVVAEFPLSTPPHRENFPVRNRIISGLSYGVVVVEASEKSGSLITARMAGEQGREVMAVPGSIFQESSRGCHALLKDGAALIQNWKDVVQQLPKDISEKVVIPESKELVEDLTTAEKNVMDLLSFEQPKNVDQIAQISGMKAQELLGVLVTLELKNRVSQMPGKQFIRLK